MKGIICVSLAVFSLSADQQNLQVFACAILFIGALSYQSQYILQKIGKLRLSEKQQNNLVNWGIVFLTMAIVAFVWFCVYCIYAHGGSII